MMTWGYGPGIFGAYGWGGIIMGLSMMAIPILGGVFLFRYFQERREEPPAWKSALEALRKRYARGEITEEAYQKIKSDIIKSEFENSLHSH